jgi:multiple sugar transport system ATP-binding protein
MTVFENLAFALRVRKVPDKQVKTEVEKMASILGLSGLLEEPAAGRNMSELQRIAIGRSLMVQATILLLDEPLSNLDADLRANMRGELKKFQLELGQTMVYVTHDQVEAMSLSDRIAVMDFGKLQQFDTPYEIYNHPLNLFVASFIGSPQMNLIEGEIRTDGDSMIFENPSIQCNLTAYRTQLEKRLLSRMVTFGIRPEHVEVLATKNKSAVGGSVCELDPMGADVVTVLECGDERVMALAKPEHVPEVGMARAVNFDLTKMHLFDKESGSRIDVRMES